MVQSLEQYVAQATQAYQPATQAIQTQLGGLDSQLETTNQQINRNYAQQQAQLNRQSNMASEQASMQSAGSGGSFGGSANLANRRYYDQSFVPAITQMQTNKSNDLATARQNYDTQKLNLQSQLQNLNAQSNNQALQQYWADVENERNRQASNAYNRFLMDQYNAEKAQKANNYYLDSNLNEWGGFNWYDGNGNLHRVGTVANAYANGGDFTNALKVMLTRASNQGDAWSQQVLNQINNGYKFAYNGTDAPTGNNIYDNMKIRLISQPTTTTTNNNSSSVSYASRGDMQKARQNK